MRVVPAETILATPVREAVDALESVLLAGFDPEEDPPRSSVPTAAGELLLMPSTAGGASGVKVLSVTPDNGARGRPRIQGAYVLFDGPGQDVAAVLDGTALTTLRTPALSALAVRHLSGDAGPVRLVVIGTGPQARAHVPAVRAVRPVAEVALVGRDEGRLRAFAEEVAATGLPVTTHGLDDCAAAVAAADVVCCCTSAERPLFDGGLVRDGAVVVAMGSHSPAAAELDAGLLARSAVVVESRAVALREAGDVVQAVAAGTTTPERLVPLADLVAGRVTLPAAGPRVFKSVGMPWQDLAVAERVYRAG
ncbi:ornithine cyclodeaminase family protein [Georgenia sp. AZ-5]|uniref:ornithine cyclodeaminase family protein n=1 Tax=Georgenia sp. AZ-5 TaxID=3367526 RepID=UPI003754D6C7